MESLKPWESAGQTGLQGQLAGLADPSSYYGYEFQRFNPHASDPTKDPATNSVCSRGWVMYEMKQEHTSLENIFRELTTGGENEQI